MRRNRGGFSPTIIVLVIAIIFLTGFFFSVTALPQFKDSFKNPFVPPPTPVGNAKNFNPMGNYDGVEVQNQNLEAKKTWKVLRKTSTGSAVLAQFEPNNYGGRTVRWKNFLIYGQTDSQNSQVFVYDFDRGETKVILDRNKSEEFSSQLRGLTGVNELTIVGDELYVSFGGYMAPAATYWFSLPNFDKVNLLAKENYGIKKIRGHYFLTSGFGDGCGGFGEHSLFDLETKKFNVVEHSEFGCSGGEQFVGLDGQDRILMAGHQPSEGDQDDFTQVFTYVLSKPLLNPDQKNGLISKEAMPKGVTVLENLEQSNRLILASNKTAWLFDLNNDTLSKAGDFPSAKIAFASEQGENACLYTYDNEYHLAVRVNLKEGKLSTDKGECLEKPKTNYSMPLTFEEFKKQLDLPEGYEVVEE